MGAIRVKVTQDNIDKGVTHSKCKCPVALAFRDLGYIAEVACHFSWIRKPTEGRSREIKNTGPMKDFIRAFDAREIVTPFEFEVEIDNQG